MLLICLVILVPICLFLIVFARQAMGLVYGAPFVPGAEYLRILVVATLFLGLGDAIASGLRGMGMPMYPTYGAVVGLGITAVGLWWAVPRFGAMGAAWVSLLAYLASFITQLLLLVHTARSWRDGNGSRTQTPTSVPV